MNDPRPSPTWPTLGQALDYLRSLGFTVRAAESGHLFARHPDDDSWFVFRDRDPNSPARALELVDMKLQLTGRGFVTDEEYARFWNQGVQPTPQPAPAPAS